MSTLSLSNTSLALLLRSFHHIRSLLSAQSRQDVAEGLVILQSLMEHVKWLEPFLIGFYVL